VTYDKECAHLQRQKFSKFYLTHYLLCKLLKAKAGVVCLHVKKLCDPHLSALEVRFLRRGAIQIHVYLHLTCASITDRGTCKVKVSLSSVTVLTNRQMPCDWEGNHRLCGK